MLTVWIKTLTAAMRQSLRTTVSQQRNESRQQLRAFSTDFRSFLKLFSMLLLRRHRGWRISLCESESRRRCHLQCCFHRPHFAWKWKQCPYMLLFDKMTKLSSEPQFTWTLMSSLFYRKSIPTMIYSKSFSFSFAFTIRTWTPVFQQFAWKRLSKLSKIGTTLIHLKLIICRFLEKK